MVEFTFLKVFLLEHYFVSADPWNLHPPQVRRVLGSVQQIVINVNVQQQQNTCVSYNHLIDVVCMYVCLKLRVFSRLRAIFNMDLWFNLDIDSSSISVFFSSI